MVNMKARGTREPEADGNKAVPPPLPFQADGIFTKPKKPDCVLEGGGEQLRQMVKNPPVGVGGGGASDGSESAPSNGSLPGTGRRRDRKPRRKTTEAWLEPLLVLLEFLFFHEKTSPKLDVTRERG